MSSRIGHINAKVNPVDLMSVREIIKICKMSSNGVPNDFLPENILNNVKQASKSSIIEKSQARYRKCYDAFKKWQILYKTHLTHTL